MLPKVALPIMSSYFLYTSNAYEQLAAGVMLIVPVFWSVQSCGNGRANVTYSLIICVLVWVTDDDEVLFCDVI